MREIIDIKNVRPLIKQSHKRRSREGSNLRPTDPQSVALSTELRDHIFSPVHTQPASILAHTSLLQKHYIKHMEHCQAIFWSVRAIYLTRLIICTVSNIFSPSTLDKSRTKSYSTFSSYSNMQYQD